MDSQKSIIPSQEPEIPYAKRKLASPESKMTSQQPKVTSQEPVTTTPLNLSSKYSNRVVLKTILERSDGGVGLVGESVVVGGWVKSSREVKKEPVKAPQPQANDSPNVSPESKDVTCSEIFQSRIPIFRSITKILGVATAGSGTNYPSREKLEPAMPRLPPPSVVFLLVSDGSSAASLQVVVDSSLASPSQLLPIGTSILAEGILKQPSVQAKHIIELKVEKILHLGPVDQDRYPLSMKRLPIETLRDCSHFRPRTTTVASVMRIRSSLTFATQIFFHNSGFLHVQVPIVTITDGEGFSEKFQVTTLLGKEGTKEEPKASDDDAGVSLEVIKAAVKEKSNLVEELKRSESNKEALVAAVQDLRKINQLASHLEAKEKLKSATSTKADKAFFSGDFFSHRTYLSVSGLLHLESYACALGSAYSFGPRFLADRKESTKQVGEMWMVEAQMAFSQLEEAMNCATDYFKFLCTWVLQNCSEDMKFFLKRIDKTSISRLESMVSCSVEKISYMDAVDILNKVAHRTFETKLQWGIALTGEHLSYLADDLYKRPVIIYNYPKEIKPFYARLNDDGKTVAAFDMVVPKVGTFITGSQSEERLDMLNARIKELGLATEQYEWYLDLRRHGTVKHSGFSAGFDLMLLFTTGLSDVRDVIPFPRSSGKVNN